MASVETHRTCLRVFFRHFAKAKHRAASRSETQTKPQLFGSWYCEAVDLYMIKSMEARLLVTQTTDGENPSPTWDEKDIENTTMCMQVYMHCLYIRLPVNNFQADIKAGSLSIKASS